jgi:hypothetical protein
MKKQNIQKQEIENTTLIIPKGFNKAYKKRKDYPKIKKIFETINYILRNPRRKY